MHKFLVKIGILFIPLFVGFLLGLITYHQLAPKPKPIIPTVIATYKGNLPCADCSGISVTLTLSSDHTYKESDVYQGKDTVFNASGFWMLVKGTPKDPNATVYQLAQAGESTSRFYEALSDKKIIQLDSDRQEIPSNLNFSLIKQ